MFATALRNLWAHKLRLMATALSITLGVAFMAGTLVLTATMRKTFDNLFADVYQGTDAVVRAKAAFEGPPGHRHAARAGRRRAGADACGRSTASRRGRGRDLRLRPADRQGRQGARQPGDRRTRPSACNWSDNTALNQFRLVSGRATAAPTTRSSSTARAPATGTSPSATPRPSSCRAGRSTCASPASRASARPTRPAGRPSWRSARPWRSGSSASRASTTRSTSSPHPGSRRPSWSRGCRRSCPRAPRRSPGRRSPRRPQSPMRKALSFFYTFLLIFAVVAVLVGGFMMFNTFSITVAQRTRENGLLRALGASRRQILASVLVEARRRRPDRLGARHRGRPGGRDRPEEPAHRGRHRHSRRRAWCSPQARL